MKLDRFLADLGSHKNGFGGGAAAALTGATGMALVEMAARLNDKRLKSSSGIAKKSEKIRRSFQTLILEDAKAFGRIQKAYKSRETKSSDWQKALKNGVKPPLKTAQLAYEGWLLIKKERARTSQWLMSDLMEAFLLLDVTYGSAILNVDANLKGIQDRAFNAGIDKKLKQSAVHRELWK